jgi:hypothetical protein
MGRSNTALDCTLLRAPLRFRPPPRCSPNPSLPFHAARSADCRFIVELGGTSRMEEPRSRQGGPDRPCAVFLQQRVSPPSHPLPGVNVPPLKPSHFPLHLSTRGAATSDATRGRRKGNCIPWYLLAPLSLSLLYHLPVLMCLSSIPCNSTSTDFAAFAD